MLKWVSNRDLTIASKVAGPVVDMLLTLLSHSAAE